MFKVGDTVSFGACEEGLPLWDMEQRRDYDWHADATGEVIKADDATFVIRFRSSRDSPYGGPRSIWTCMQVAPVDADEHWFRPARAALVARGEPVWIESIGIRRGAELPDPVRSRAIDTGERGVRRNLRVWPYEQRLVWEEARIPGDLEDRVEFRWFWEATA